MNTVSQAELARLRCQCLQPLYHSCYMLCVQCGIYWKLHSSLQGKQAHRLIMACTDVWNHGTDTTFSETPAAYSVLSAHQLDDTVTEYCSASEYDH